MTKSADAFRTISEVAEELELPQHVLRFWETRFPQIKPLKRAGGRRYYRPRDIEILRAVKQLLYGEGYTIKGVQRVLKGHGAVTAANAMGGDGGSDYVSDTMPNMPPLGEGDWQARDVSEASPQSAAKRDETRDKTGPDFVWPVALSSEDIVRLRAALAELAECQTILEAARRR
ncbi:MerR family transcriptional regulator [Beijerinckiaceae bacterium]|nr:MerR family transcriptional regulator [Beijerinckiaceae bacterium]